VQESVVEFECVSREISRKKGIKWPLTEEMVKSPGNTFAIRWVINKQSVARVTAKIHLRPCAIRDSQAKLNISYS
jgi:hypothetical protein